MIPLAELLTDDGVYVLHFSEPLAHARGYVGWATGIARRVAEHLDVAACRRAGYHLASHRGSPLVCAAIRAGRAVLVVQVYPGGDRGLERRLHNRHHPCQHSAADGPSSRFAAYDRHACFRLTGLPRSSRPSNDL